MTMQNASQEYHSNPNKHPIKYQSRKGSRKRPRVFVITTLFAIVLWQQLLLPSTALHVQVRKLEHVGPRYYSTRQQQCQALDEHEEQERRKLQWLVRTTAKLLQEESPTSPLLNKHAIKQAHMAMKSWGERTSHQTGSNAPHVVEQILSRLVQERDLGNQNVVITTKVYNIVIDAWSKSDAQGAAQRALEILEEMERLGNPHVKPDMDSYLGVVKALVRNGYSVDRVEAIVNRMKQHGLSVTQRGYTLLLYALANSKEQGDNVAKRALDIFKTLKKEYQATGDELLRPSTNTYNQVLFVLGSQRGNEDKAQEVFDEVLADAVVTPNTDTFNAILKCWLKSNNEQALDRMYAIIDIMKGRHQVADIVTVNTMLAAIAKYGRAKGDSSLDKALAFHETMERDYGVSPDTISNNILIDCWSKSRRANAPEHVLHILDEMESEFKHGDHSVKPDACTYASVIDCLVKCGNKAGVGERADSLVERMRKLHHHYGGDAPNVSVHNACLNAWAVTSSGRSDNKGATDRAESILREMIEYHDSAGTIPAPNKQTYNIVLKAMRNSNHAESAEALLGDMEEQAKHDKSLSPDSYSYTSAITALARSRIPDKATKALAILERMIDSYENERNLDAKPRIHAFNACLNACAFTKSRDARYQIEAFLVTVSVIGLLQKYATPDSLTYSTVLRACSTLLAPDDERRDIVAKSLFQRACKEGLVDRTVIDQFKFAASSNLYRQSLSGVIDGDNDRGVRIRDLPREWVGRVRQQSRNTR